MSFLLTETFAGILSDAECIKYSGLFDAKWYLALYPDVVQAKVDPLKHYLKLGGFESRFPSVHFDSRWYLSEHPDIGKINPLVHYVRFGKKLGYQPLPPSPDTLLSTPNDSRPSKLERIFLTVQELIAPLIFKVQKFIWGINRRWNKIEELCSYIRELEVPQVSILIRTYGNWANIEKSLQSMLDHPAMTSYEVLIINDDPERSKDLSRWVQNQTDLLRRTQSRVFSSSMNVGFVSSINILSRKARGTWLFLLNDDTEICSMHWLDALVDTIRSDKNIGAAGSMLLFPHSNLVCHAGLYPVVREDGKIGNAHFYKYFNRNYPDVNIQREVPVLTGAAFLIAQKLFVEMGRLDEGYRNAGGLNDADLSHRLTQKGYKLIFVPESVICHDEGQTNKMVNSNNDRRCRNQQYYSIKWKEFLKKRYDL